MSEITKLYENAGFKKREIENCTYKNSTPCGHICDDGEDCPYLEIKEDYPPFTAEKQIELIKYFSDTYNISINKIDNIFRLLFINKDGIHNFYTSGVDFAEQLALFVISRYKNQILTDAEKQQVKGILE